MIGYKLRVSVSEHYTCTVHSWQGATPNCPYCDLCEHGKMRTQHCAECAKDDWIKAPLTESEIAEIRRYIRQAAPLRHPSNPRDYRTVSLTQKLLDEFDRLRLLGDQG